MESAIRIQVVEDHDLVLRGLEATIASTDDLVVAATAADIPTALDRLSDPALDIDLTLTDLRLPGGSGADVAVAAGRRTPPVPVLMLTGVGSEVGARAAIDSGCAGFVQKGQGLASLIAAVRTVAGGGTVYEPSLLLSVARAGGSETRRLTDRELDVLAALATGRPVAEIANDLSLSLHTVRNHVKAILDKLQASSQLQAVVAGVRAGLVTIA